MNCSSGYMVWMVIKKEKPFYFLKHLLSAEVLHEHDYLSELSFYYFTRELLQI